MDYSNYLNYEQMKKELLYDAIKKGMVDVVSAIINATNKNAFLLESCLFRLNIDFLGQTALMVAAENGHLEIVNLLLRTAGDKAYILISTRSYDGKSALVFAAKNGHLSILNTILEAAGEKAPEVVYPAKGFELDRTALKISVENGRADIVSALINAAGNRTIHLVFSKTGAMGETALMLAAEKGHFNIVKILLKAAGSYASQLINLRDSLHNKHALMFAAENGHLEIVKILLVAAGNKLNDILQARTVGSYYTALMLACKSKSKNTDIVKTLIEAAINGTPDFKKFLYRIDSRQRTALVHACSENHDAAVFMLMDAMQSDEAVFAHKDHPVVSRFAIRYLNKKCDLLDESLKSILNNGPLSIVASYYVLEDEESKRRYFPSSANIAIPPAQQNRRQREEEGTKDEPTVTITRKKPRGE